MAFQRAGYLTRRAIWASRARGHRARFSVGNGNGVVVRTIPKSSPSSVASALTRLFLADTLKEEVDPGAVEGTDLRIVKYPHPSLRAHNEEVTEEELKDGSIAKLAKEMFLVM